MTPRLKVVSRRRFIQTSGTVAAAVAGASVLGLPAMASESKAQVSLVLDPDSPFAQEPSVRWAADQLEGRLAARGVSVLRCPRLDLAPAAQICVLATESSSIRARSFSHDTKVSLPESAESFALGRMTPESRPLVLAVGTDARGLVYALLELADRVQFADDPSAALHIPEPICERPANPIRGVARAFVSDVEDKPWYQDREFWSRYLTLLAAQRFNRFHLMLGIGYDFTTNITDCYFHFAYPFLLAVPGYNVRAEPLPDAERDLNLQMLRFISDEAARRGLHFQLGIWTHAYKWTNSPDANFMIHGLTPESHGPYCRDALSALLKACPNIKGVTFRIHGESGVPEGNYDLWKVIFDGVAQCGRPVEIDMHAKGMDQGMIDVALGTGMAVNISPKFWAEHMGLPYMQGAIRSLEMPPRNPRTTGFFSRSSGSRSFLRYGYGDLLAEDRRYGVLQRLWPGSQRLLLWSDPEMAAAYGRASSFCGSVGLEIMEPLTFKGRKGSGLPGGRNGYADLTLKPEGGDFEKYANYYRVWGRSLYSPDGDTDGKRRWLKSNFGRGAEAMESALAAAGKILPLVTTAHCPSAANNNYWPEMYFNMPIVDAKRRHPYSDTPSPKRLGMVSPLDPQFFLGIDAFAEQLLSNTQSGMYSPAWVAAQLDAAADLALACLRKAKARSRYVRNVDFRRFEIDAAIQAGLGKFFAAKFRAGVLYAIYSRTGNLEALEKAFIVNRDSRRHWAEMVDTMKDAYRDDITVGPEYFQRGHWRDRLPAMDEDIADMENLLVAVHGPDLTKVEPKIVAQAIRAVFADRFPELAPPLPGLHVPPASYRRGDSVTIMAHAPRSDIFAITLNYRHVNQSEKWENVEMQKTGRVYEAAIPAEYTDSRYPLQYYFQVRAGENNAWLYPGLEPGWQGQPYFVVRQG